jgi:hypothetical protein
VEVFIKTSQDLDGLAETLRDILSLPGRNRSAYQADQAREGANYGGRYYLFEVLGLELYLLSNAGDAEIPGFPAFPYYLFLEGRSDADEQTLEHLTIYLRDVLRDAGIEAEISAGGSHAGKSDGGMPA